MYEANIVHTQELQICTTINYLISSQKQIWLIGMNIAIKNTSPQNLNE